MTLVVALVAGGCAKTGDDDMKTGCWSVNMSGEQLYLPDELKRFVAACDLTPEDTYLVNLREFFLREESSLAGRSPAEVRALLDDYHLGRGDDWNFLEYNPATGQPLADYASARYVFLFLGRANEEGAPRPLAEVLIDLEAGSVRWGTDPYALLIDTSSGTLQPLAQEQREQLVALLASATADWSQPDPQRTPAAWTASVYTYWTLAVCADDYSLRRFEGFVGEGGPPGLDEFVASFGQIIGVDLRP
ncbi:MAG: hypothetical protein LBK42_09385 [Propionibacteriaceae bacterium]|nr:hypothetical protein [Propionibacteriaceae bacterium]